MSFIKHNHSGRGKRSKIYNCWLNMVARCTNPLHPSYKDYGGRGIAVCVRWRTFAHFLLDVGESKPKDTLDRIDNNKGYEPGNVRWITHDRQMLNTRRNRMITWQGETRTVVEWAEKLGIRRKTLDHRINRGWSIERAFTTPVQVKRR